MTREQTLTEREPRLQPDVSHLIDLNSTVETLQREPHYGANGRNGIVLVKNREMRVVLQAMRSGARLAEHYAPGPIAVQVLEGEIEFSIGETIHAMRPGELLVVPSRVPHTVVAVRDAVFLLTIAPLSHAED